MAIEFGPLDEATGALRLPRFIVLGVETPGTGGDGVVRLPLMVVAGEAADTQVYNGALELPLPFIVATESADDVGRVRLPAFEVVGSESAIELEFDLGAISLPLPYVDGLAGPDTQVYNGALQLPAMTTLGSEAAEFGVVTMPAMVCRGYEPSPTAAWISFLGPFHYTYATGTTTVLTEIRVLADSLGLSDDLDFDQILRIVETLRLTETFTLTLQQIERLRDQLGLSDSAVSVLVAFVVEVLGLADTPAGMAVIARQLVDTLGLSAGITSTAQVIALVATILALRDHGAPAETATLAETLALADAVTASATAYERLIETLRLSDLVAGNALLVALVRDSFALSDTASQTAQLLRLLRDSLALRIEVSDGDTPLVAWILGTESRAAWSYEDWPFNSYAEIAGRHYAAGPTGIVELGGADDDGEPIDALIRTGLTNMGTGRLKRLESAYIGYTSDGVLGLAVTVTSPEGQKVEHRYRLTPRTADAPREARFKVGRGLKSVYWQFEVSNVDGADFELMNLQLLPMILDRGI